MGCAAGWWRRWSCCWKKRFGLEDRKERKKSEEAEEEAENEVCLFTARGRQGGQKRARVHERAIVV